MNYVKLGLYGVIFTLFLYPLMGMAAPGETIFISDFFTSTGFICVALFAITMIYFSAYSWEYGKKKSAADKKAGEKKCS